MKLSHAYQMSGTKRYDFKSFRRKPAEGYFGKWLEREPKVFMMDEPTRGIDVGAKYEIYDLIIQMAKQGKTIIVVSSEMPEILGITNRIGVMSNGRLAGIVNTKETNQEELLRLSAKYL